MQKLSLIFLLISMLQTISYAHSRDGEVETKTSDVELSISGEIGTYLQYDNFNIDYKNDANSTINNEDVTSKTNIDIGLEIRVD